MWLGMRGGGEWHGSIRSRVGGVIKGGCATEDELGIRSCGEGERYEV